MATDIHSAGTAHDATSTSATCIDGDRLRLALSASCGIADLAFALVALAERWRSEDGGVDALVALTLSERIADLSDGLLDVLDIHSKSTSSDELFARLFPHQSGKREADATVGGGV